MRRSLTSIVVFVLLLEILYKVGVRVPYVPSPIEILKSAFILISEGVIVNDILSSTLRVGIGFVIASISGVLLGLFLGFYKKIGLFASPIIEIFRPIPPIAWIPISILIWGLGNTSVYFIIFIGGFFPIFTNTYFGALSIPSVYQNISRTLELSVGKYITKVLLPYTLPYIFSGLKSGIGMAWMSVIAAELISTQSGLGYFIQYNRLLLRTDYIVVGMLMIGIIGFTFVSIINMTESFFIKWK